MGGEMSEKGEAYTELSNQYVIHKLPVPVRRRDRNVYLFDGWYTSADGGVKLNEGDFIEKGVTLYAHWKAVPKKCDVTCIDVLQTAGGEEVLGTTTFQAEYGELASGSAIGCSTGSGIYYPGRDYVGCSDSIVQAEGTVVYRYFKNASRNVFCIDVVQVLTGCRTAAWKPSVAGGIWNDCKWRNDWQRYIGQCVLYRISIYIQLDEAGRG